MKDPQDFLAQAVRVEALELRFFCNFIEGLGIRLFALLCCRYSKLECLISASEPSL